MEKKLLEYFRLNNYLGQYLAILSDNTHPKVEMSYNNYAVHAFYGLSDDINDLENEKNFVNNGRRALVGISFWYLALESFVNCLCKITAMTLAMDPGPLIKQDIGSRISWLLQTMQYDRMVVKQSGIYNRINDFRQYRNEIFHDRHTGIPVKFEKTNFSPISVLSNQADVFQALLIFLETLTLFRFCIPGLDLMANISIGNSEVLHFDKLNSLYSVYLVPYFLAVLDKQDLQTSLDLNIDKYSSLQPSSLFHKGEIVPISRHEQEEHFKHPMNQQTTSIGHALYRRIVDSYQLPKGTVSGLNFVIDWEEMYKSKFPVRR